MSAIAARHSAENGTPRFNAKRALALTLDALRSSIKLSHSVVVVIGSHAHGAATRRSDLDVLVLSDESRPKVRAPEGIHLQFRAIDSFRQRIREGDDYAIAAARFGKPVYDRGRLWSAVRDEVQRAPWPDWREKMGYARDRLRLAEELLATRDVPAAFDEALSAATQLARASLFRRGIFPESRPQLCEQLVSVGETELNRVLSKLLTIQREEFTQRELRPVLHQLSRTLAHAGESERAKPGGIPLRPRHMVCVASGVLAVLALGVPIPYPPYGYVVVYSCLAILGGASAIDWLLWVWRRNVGHSHAR